MLGRLEFCPFPFHPTPCIVAIVTGLMETQQQRSQGKARSKVWEQQSA